MKEYGFSEGTDFYSFLSKTTEQGGRPATDYVLSLDMAKELCMIQRTERGKQENPAAWLFCFLCAAVLAYNQLMPYGPVS